MRVSVEIVPRSKDTLVSNFQLIKKDFPIVDTINIPDLIRCDIRSWDGCVYANDFFQNNIPHIRAIDINLKEPLKMGEFLREENIKEVLIISGDPPQDMSRKVYPSNSVDMIKKFKEELPEVKVYAAVDQYRASFKQEMEYVNKKFDAGADGLFFQPFFDMRLLEIYADIFEGAQLFIGISPVTSLQSMNYWEAKNNVVFPKRFVPNLEWNVDFAKKAMEFCKNKGLNIYFMPIRIDLHTYLSNVL